MHTGPMFGLWQSSITSQKIAPLSHATALSCMHCSVPQGTCLDTPPPHPFPTAKPRLAAGTPLVYPGPPITSVYQHRLFVLFSCVQMVGWRTPLCVEVLLGIG